MTARCRWCGQPILWALVEHSRRRLPLDPTPHPDGTIVRVDVAAGVPVVVVTRDERAAADYLTMRPAADLRYTPHPWTCPGLEARRRARRRR